jgi:hypothetical protein
MVGNDSAPVMAAWVREGRGQGLTGGEEKMVHGYGLEERHDTKEEGG